MTAIHDSLIFIDGLVISKWSRPVFADMRKGGLTAANALLNLGGVCRDDARDIAQWKRWFTENADLITLVRSGRSCRPDGQLCRDGSNARCLRYATRSKSGTASASAMTPKTTACGERRQRPVRCSEMGMSPCEVDAREC
jgi:hypothetical protein